MEVVQTPMLFGTNAGNITPIGFQLEPAFSTYVAPAAFEVLLFKHYQSPGNVAPER